MKNRILILAFGFLCAPGLAFGACSRNNLTKCLDSVCAINFGMNPAARCQYCGSASAGEPVSNGMKSVGAGASKYELTDKELKKAPTDPGERYVWATNQCLKKVDGCDADDVTDTYDSLIEQSCKAAGISAAMVNLAQKVNTAKSQSTCSTDISSCLINEKRCGAGYTKCKDEADFDKYFSDCGVLSTGCEQYLTQIRSKLFASRNDAIKNADQVLKNIVAAYQKNRQQKYDNTRQSCKDGEAKQQCIAQVCNNNMRHKCELGFEYEETLAGQLCKFYDVACERLK